MVTKEYKAAYAVKHRQECINKGICVDCPNKAFQKIEDGRLKIYTRCKQCLYRMAQLQSDYRERQNAKRTSQNDSSRNSSNSQQEEQGLRAGR